MYKFTFVLSSTPPPSFLDSNDAVYKQLILTCLAGANGVQACGVGTYCCYGFDGCDCSDSTQVFTLGSIELFTSIASTPSQASITTSSMSEDGTAVSTSWIRSTITDAITTPTSASSTQSPEETNHSDTGVAIGVAVGIGIPFVLAIAGGLWFWRRKRRTTDDKTGDGGSPREIQELQDTQHVPDMHKYEMDVPQPACSELPSSSLEPAELIGSTRY